MKRRVDTGDGTSTTRRVQPSAGSLAVEERPAGYSAARTEGEGFEPSNDESAVNGFRDLAETV